MSLTSPRNSSAARASRTRRATRTSGSSPASAAGAASTTGTNSGGQEETALTEAELEQAQKGAGPGENKIVAAAVAAAIAGAALVGGGIFGLTDAPQAQDHQVVAADRVLDTQVLDPQDVLGPDEERGLVADAERIHAPEVVQHLRYLVFAENDENVNDTVENFLRDNHPELIGEDAFADGVLIVGVGLDPRQAFVFAGDDVADELDLHGDTGHLEDSQDAIKPGVRDGNLRGGLFAGAHEAADAQVLSERALDSAETDRTVGVVLGGAGAAIAAGSTVGGVGAFRRRRARRLARARAELSVVTREYAQLAGRLDQIDVRAHSLSSPLADATLRRQWAQVRDRFLSIHDDIDSLGALQLNDDEALLERADEISAAARDVRRVSTAEDNIDRIFRMENGDATVRRAELGALRDDVVAAQVELDDADSGLYRELDGIRARAEKLDAQLAAGGAGGSATDSGFVEAYLRLLGDYRTALERFRETRYDDVDESKASELRTPAVYERDYRPGYTTVDFVPFWIMSSWHTSNAEAQSASSSGGVNASFSSGFSGAGGSSSF